MFIPEHHPALSLCSESHVNVFCLVAVCLKWAFLSYSVVYTALLSFGEFEIDQSVSGFLFTVFQIVATLTTIGEMAFRFYVGYVDPVSDRIVMEPFRVYDHYLKSKHLFPLDFVSLLPFWLCTRWLYPIHVPPEHMFSPGMTLMHRLIRVLPLFTIIIQLARSMELFRRPPQAQPFNRHILSLKYMSKVLFTVLSLFIVFALLWLTVGCPTSVEIMQCQSHGWIHVAFITNPEIIETEIDLLMTALNFVVSVASGAGFGDVSAHNKSELALVVGMIVLFTFINCQLQAQVLTAVYASVLRQVRRVGIFYPF